jgi:hypothetical protein
MPGRYRRIGVAIFLVEVAMTLIVVSLNTQT